MSELADIALLFLEVRLILKCGETELQLSRRKRGNMWKGACENAIHDLLGQLDLFFTSAARLQINVIHYRIY